MNKIYDLIIIGSGPGGYRAAVLAALKNLSVAIVEKHLWGGCCLNRGCVPKKAWHHTASLVAHQQSLAQTGIEGKLNVNFQQAWQHQQQTSAKVRENYTNYMKRLGIDAFEGRGTLNSYNTVEVTNGKSVVSLEGNHIILATGSTPLLPENVDISQRLISTDELFEFSPPEGESVGLIGSGVIATELAFILSAMGKQVKWFSRSPVLNRSDFSEQAISTLKSAFEGFNIALPKQDIPEKYIESKHVTLHFSDGSEETVDWVLFATGRKPHTCKLGLEYTNILVDDSGFIRTNEFLQTHEENIYAIGDVRTPLMTANQAISDATIAVNNIAKNNTQTFKTHQVPQAIYSAIEMARVGLNEEQAEDEGYEPATGFAAFESSPTALGQNDTQGFLRLIADMDNGKFLGGEIVGKNAGELIHVLAMEQNNDHALKHFADLIVNHPSRSEEIVNATETLANKWNMQDFIFKE